MLRLRKGLYLLEAGASVNACLLETAKGLILVDAGPAERAGALLAEISNAGFDLSSLEAVVLTNSRPDHVGGADAVVARKRVKVFAHPADIPAIQRTAPPPAGLLARLARRLEEWRHPYRPPEIVVPVRQGESLRALASWQVLDTPGRTPGSISLYNPAERVLLCGDALDNSAGALGISPRCAPADVPRARLSALGLAALECDTICFGHGPPLRGDAALRLLELEDRLKAKG